MARYCSEAIEVSGRNERGDLLPDFVAAHRLTPERISERRSTLRGSCINILASDWSFLTKKQLERLIWLKSTLELSKQLGVSDVAISKRCHREGIQKPPRGFWAKVTAGKIKHPQGRVAKSKNKK